MMKTKKPFLLPALIAALNLMLVGQAPAQTFTALGDRYSSSDSPGFLGNTVYASLNELALSGNVFYGTYPGYEYPGASGGIYAKNTDGTGFTNLHVFSEIPTSGYGPRRNADGARPLGGVILSGNTLYGTTSLGGTYGGGTIFKLSTNGTGFTVLANLGSRAGLVLSGDTLYGTGYAAGSYDMGYIFKISTNGTGFTTLHNFTALTSTDSINYTNSDGIYPAAGLILSGNTLYGTASSGGSGGAGTVFAIKTNGTGFTTLYSFTPRPYPGTNSDGGNPQAGLVLSGNTLYGTAYDGGSSGNGTVFAVNTNGTGFTNLYSFPTTYPFVLGPYFVYTNAAGAFPQGTLALSGHTLYGTTSEGGSVGQETPLHVPWGTVFSLSFEPQLTLIRSGTSIILSWPTNVAGFDSAGYTLQSATNLVSPVVWSTNSPEPTLVNGQYRVTNSISGTQKFYRLGQVSP